MIRRTAITLALGLMTAGFSTLAHAETVTTEPIPGGVYISDPSEGMFYEDAPTTISVTVASFLETAQTVVVTLEVDEVLQDFSCETAGDCVFEGIVLEEGVHTLRAEGVFDGSYTDAHQVTVYVGEPPPEETTTTETTGGDSDSNSETGGETMTTGETEGTGEAESATTGETGDTGETVAGVGTDSGDSGDGEKGGCAISPDDRQNGLALALLLGVVGLVRRRR